MQNDIKTIIGKCKPQIGKFTIQDAFAGYCNQKPFIIGVDIRDPFKIPRISLYISCNSLFLQTRELDSIQSNNHTILPAEQWLNRMTLPKHKTDD